MYILEKKRKKKRETAAKIPYQHPPGDMPIQVPLPDPSIWPREQQQHDHGPHGRGNRHRQKANYNPNHRQDDSNPSIIIHEVSPGGRPGTPLPDRISRSGLRRSPRPDARFEAALQPPDPPQQTSP